MLPEHTASPGSHGGVGNTGNFDSGLSRQDAKAAKENEALWTSKRCAIGLAALLLAACAGNRPPPNPDAQACLPPENPAMRSRDYYMRLGGYTQRADAFAACMTGRGYVLDENELEARMLHFEQVRNAEWLGGDPIWAMRIYREEQRINPELWQPGP
jgi:hypothetical protein